MKQIKFTTLGIVSAAQVKRNPENGTHNSLALFQYQVIEVLQ
jgi:hypothetical protein